MIYIRMKNSLVRLKAYECFHALLFKSLFIPLGNFVIRFVAVAGIILCSLYALG